MSWLQIRLFGPYFSSFSTNSYSYYSQMSQNLVSNTQIFASALIVRQAASRLCVSSLYLYKATAHTYLSLNFDKSLSNSRYNQASVRTRPKAAYHSI